MKILAVERYPHQWLHEATAALDSDDVASPGCLPLSVIADSAIVRNGMPMFIPDFAREWSLAAVPFFTIGRLGKSIPVRFANRYIESCGIALRLTPPGNNLLPPANFLSGLATGFDGALAPGKTFPYAAAADMHISTSTGEQLTLTPAELHIEETVALISRYMMLKMGDIIIPCVTPLRLPVETGTTVTVTLNTDTAIELKLR